MNIKITYNWLREYLDTDADAYELQKYLSLSGPSVERVDKDSDDFVLDIEITSNRIDMASVIGVARETQAILPQHGKKAVLKNTEFPSITGNKNLPITITDPEKLCNRVMGIVLDNVEIGPSPEHIKKRLEMCGIRSLNNIIDITNYVMLETGHPTHAFDYDRIQSHTLLLRKAKSGEKTKTLDEKVHELKENDIVIDDGTGVIIDLPGIMGTANSVVTNNTKRVLFFTENNNPKAIRQTSMRLGIRTDAATINDKGPDPELTKIAFQRGVQLYQEVTKATVASEIIDIYPNPRKPKTIEITLSNIQKLMGIEIGNDTVVKILDNLGFKVDNHEGKYVITIPTSRIDDVSIKQDIVEEVARVYGYGNLPSNIAPMVFIKQPKEIEKLFTIQNKIKLFFKSIGLHEVMNYSLISEKLIDDLGLKKEDHLRLANTISKEIEYMRLSLLPSLIQNSVFNQGKKDVLKFFEIAKVYPKREGDLPNEQYKLAIATTTDFADLKGIIETLFNHLHIRNYSFKKSAHSLFAPNVQAEIVDTKTNNAIGTIGKLNRTSQEIVGMKNDAYLVEIDFSFVIDNYKVVEAYKEPPQFAMIKRDATIKPNGKTYEDIKQKAFQTSKLLIDVEYLSSYKDAITLRFYFSSPEKNSTEEDAQRELDAIVKALVIPA